MSSRSFIDASCKRHAHVSPAVVLRVGNDSSRNSCDSAHSNIVFKGNAGATARKRDGVPRKVSWIDGDGSTDLVDYSTEPEGAVLENLLFNLTSSDQERELSLIHISEPTRPY